MSKKPKKMKKPFALKVINAYIGFTQVVLPFVAKKTSYKLFFKPFKYPVKKDEIPTLKTATLSSLQYKNQHTQVYSWGDGSKTILCMHGWSGRALQFYKIINPLLKKGYRVVAFDAPGHFKSEGNHTTIIEYKELIVKLHDEYKFESVIAHSMGCAATLLAVKDGLTFSKLALISPPVISDLIIKEYCYRIGANKSVGKYILNRIEREFGRPFHEFFPVHYLPLPNTPETIIIHDKDDRDVPFTNGEKLKSLIPEAQFVQTQKLGHTRIMRNDVVVKQISDFIN